MNKDLVDLYSKKLLCLGEEDSKIFGDYNSARAQLLNVQLIKCNNETRPDLDCKTEEEITAFFRNKFIILVYN